MKMRPALVDTSGLIVLEEDRRGRTWRSEILPDGDVTLAEAAVLCGVSRATVYRWADSEVGRTYWSKGARLHVDDGRVTLPELRRFLQARGSWWLDDHPMAKIIAKRGPVAAAPEPETS